MLTSFRGLVAVSLAAAGLSQYAAAFDEQGVRQSRHVKSSPSAWGAHRVMPSYLPSCVPWRPLPV